MRYHITRSKRCWQWNLILRSASVFSVRRNPRTDALLCINFIASLTLRTCLSSLRATSTKGQKDQVIGNVLSNLWRTIDLILEWLLPLERWSQIESSTPFLMACLWCTRLSCQSIEVHAQYSMRYWTRMIEQVCLLSRYRKESLMLVTYWYGLMELR